MEETLEGRPQQKGERSQKRSMLVLPSRVAACALAACLIVGALTLVFGVAEPARGLYACGAPIIFFGVAEPARGLCAYGARA